MANFYDILGVSKGASDDDIKKAYRKLAHKHHPDKAGGDEKKFKEINEAYQVLSDKTKRSQYDQFGQTFNSAQGGQAGGFGGFDFSGFQGFGSQGSQGSQGFEFNFGGEDLGDIFSDIFGGGRRASRRKKRGADIQVDIEITFSEMAKGVEKEINLRKTKVCEECGGTGGEKNAGKKTCPTCKGSGQIQKNVRSIFGSFSQVTECPECQGEGEIYERKCRHCGGDGRVKGEERIKVKIPAGIQNGQAISIRGAGEMGEKGSMPGDLYVGIRVRTDKKFIRKGQDVLSVENIPFSLATLGGKIEVETVFEKLILKIPTGTQSGEVFRIKGQGIPDLGGRSVGNHLVEIKIQTPRHLSREQKDLLEKLKDAGI